MNKGLPFIPLNETCEVNDKEKQKVKPDDI